MGTVSMADGVNAYPGRAIGKHDGRDAQTGNGVGAAGSTGHFFRSLVIARIGRGQHAGWQAFNAHAHAYNEFYFFFGGHRLYHLR